MRVRLEERLRSKESFGFGGPVFQWWVERGGGSGGFPCCAGCIGAEFMPVITVVADEIGDFAEGLVRYDVLEGHGSVMGGILVVAGDIRCASNLCVNYNNSQNNIIAIGKPP